MGKRRTQEELIEDFIEVHGYTYDYSDVIFTKMDEDVNIRCKKHGIFEQTPKCHIIGQGCPKCGVERANKTRLKDVNYVKDRSLIVHGDIFDFKDFIYVDNKTNGVLTCKVCNHVFNRKPNDLLNGCGCPKCSRLKKTKSKEEFVKKSVDKHGDLCNYDKFEYINKRTEGIIVCNKHNIEFKQTPSAHYENSACPACVTENRRKSQEDFIKEVNEKHNNFYTYPYTEYIDAHTEVIITCPIHGNFKQKPCSHSNGRGCPDCARDLKGFSRTAFIQRAKNEKATFYILQCFNENEKFYKIGITKNTVKVRYNKSEIPYKYKVMSEIKEEAGIIYDIEKHILRTYTHNKYKPSIYFPGHSECISNEINIEEITKNIKEFLKNIKNE